MENEVLARSGMVSAEFGPIDVGIVDDYLNACVEAGIIDMGGK